MARTSKRGRTLCDEHSDCFANKNGKCVCLTDTDFKDKKCPFYKPESEISLKQIAAECKDYALLYEGRGGEE